MAGRTGIDEVLQGAVDRGDGRWWSRWRPIATG